MRMLWALSVLCVAYIGVSVWSFLNYGQDPKTCDGNYIIPGYFDPEFRSSQSVLNKRYSLLLHREGARKGLSGLPVLFIPGNAGNFKQIRSFGGVAHRIARWEQERLGGPNMEIDLFAMETRKELSAFNVKHLENQAEYASEAIQFILGLYRKEKSVITPKSVVIIGHSMGGIVARKIPLLDTYLEGSISIIITLASPHYEPPFALNRAIYLFYQHLNNEWRQGSQLKLRNITIVSIASGNRDLVLYSGLTHLDGIVEESRGFTVYSTGMPGFFM
jgi:pimeloyl-ACP methyl ester carboxylesterase